MVDSEPLWFEVEKEFARARGFEWTHDLARTCVGRGVPSLLEMMRDTFGVEIHVAQDADFIVNRFIERVGELALKPGCAELLAAAKGKVPLALASSSSPRLIGAVLERFALAPLFDAVVSGESVPRPKPAPDIFLKTAGELGVPPARCVVLEDSPAGAAAGRAAGMIVFAVPEGPPEGRGFDATADAVLPDLFAALALLDFSESAGTPGS